MLNCTSMCICGWRHNTLLPFFHQLKEYHNTYAVEHTYVRSFWINRPSPLRSEGSSPTLLARTKHSSARMTVSTVRVGSLYSRTPQECTAILRNTITRLNLNKFHVVCEQTWEEEAWPDRIGKTAETPQFSTSEIQHLSHSVHILTHISHSHTIDNITHRDWKLALVIITGNTIPQSHNLCDQTRYSLSQVSEIGRVTL